MPTQRKIFISYRRKVASFYHNRSIVRQATEDLQHGNQAEVEHRIRKLQAQLK